MAGLLTVFETGRTVYKPVIDAAPMVTTMMAPAANRPTQKRNVRR